MASRIAKGVVPGSNGNRVAIYVRVSTQGQAEEGFSLEAQLKICRKFAGDRGWKVVAEFTEPGVSAKDDNRPEFRRMIGLARAGQFDIILTHKLDRFSRSILDVLTYLRDLNTAGVTYASATEQFDFSTPMGKMQLHIMAALAEWYLDNLSQETQKGKRARAEAGLWNGDPPFGYRTAEKGRLDVDETEAAGVRLAFELCASGLYTDTQVAEKLNEAGYRTRGKWGRNLFSKDTVRPMLRNRFYLGMVKYRREPRSKEYELYPGRHQPLIEPDLWDRAQEARLQRRAKQPRTKATAKIYPLSGLVRCSTCKRHMRGSGRGVTRYYRDTSKEHGVHCDQPLSPARALEDQLVGFFSCLKLDPVVRETLLSRIADSGSRKNEPADELARLDEQLGRAKKLFMIGDLSEKEYLQEKERIGLARSQVALVEPPDLEKAEEFLKDYSSLLATATDEERRLFFQTVLQEVFVDKKKVVAVRPKPNYHNLLRLSKAGATGFEPAISALTGPRVWPATPRPPGGIEYITWLQDRQLFRPDTHKPFTNPWLAVSVECRPA